MADGSARNGDVVIRINRRSSVRRLALHPSLELGEAYMDGDVVVEEGTLYSLLALIIFNISQAGCSGVLGWPDRFAKIFRHHLMNNRLENARRNVAHHYDLSEQFYRLFLDEGMQYSCAYFEHPHMTLEQAQEAKLRHIASKLMLKPGQHVLDIGCGWGKPALYLAGMADVKVTGITLSREQLKVASSRAEACGMADKVTFELCDYRDVSGQYDRIVSIGMFEHVGVGNYLAFFEKVKDLLTDDGIALIHSIGRLDGPGATNSWIRKYIFPGGYSPALSEVLNSVEKSGAIVTDIEILRLHYALTLNEWRRRFLANYGKAKELYGDKFCKMWEFYLSSCEASFRYDNMMVFQLQLSKSLTAIPLTRDYMFGDFPSAGLDA